MAAEKFDSTGVGSILSEDEILSNLGQSVIISPFNADQVAPCSYDVTLGAYYWVPNLDNIPKFLVPENGRSISQYWGLDPKCLKTDAQGRKIYGASRAFPVLNSEIAAEYGVDVGDELIVIQPGHVILAHTQEFIGGQNNVTTMLKAKSSLGRCGISVCKCAGWGDCGYINRWTLEIENHSLAPVILKVGQRVGQMVFLRTGGTSTPYYIKGQYQKTNDLKMLIDEWSPLSMLPGKAVMYLESLILKE